MQVDEIPISCSPNAVAVERSNDVRQRFAVKWRPMILTRLKRMLAPDTRSDTPDGPPNRDRIAGLLQLRVNDEYSRRRATKRNQTIERLSDCSPANSSPAALAGYVGEAALRFSDTVEWTRLSLNELALARPRLLEIGSNPYFLTLLIAERLPEVEHFGVNYFGAETPVMETQEIMDGQRRLAQSRFFHADIERHDLEPTGQFNVALFCEVLEHLPYDPAWALYNIVRRLKPGGHLILTTPNPARLDNIVRLAEHRETFSDPISGHGIHGRHNREYSARELKEMVEGSGCTVLGLKTIDVIPEGYSHDAESRGYGAYHMVRAVLSREAELYRPDWLYRGFNPDQLRQRGPLTGR